MKNALNAILVGMSLLALSAAQAQAAQWPLSQPTHAAYFCGADGGEHTDETPPKGYGQALSARLREFERRGMNVAQAMAEIRRSVDCGRLAARSTGWVRLDETSLRLLGWKE